MLSPDELIRTAARLCPDFAPAGPATRTETSLLQPASWRGTAVIAKTPTDPRPWWLERGRHEIRVYRAIADNAPPVPTPRLIAADPAVPVLVITRLPGRPMHPDRYVTADAVSPAQLRRLLATLRALHTWAPPPAAIPDDRDYPAQLAALPAGLLTPADIARLTRLHHQAQPPPVASHGDPHPGNTIVAANDPARLALIDFELVAWRPVGHDHAKLWTLCMAAPDLKNLVLADVGTGPAALAGFWIAAILTIAREILSYWRQGHQDRVTALTADLHHALVAAKRLPTR